MSKRKFFCFNAKSEPLREDLRTWYFPCDMNIPYKHCCAIRRIFVYSTVVCSSITHTMQWLCERATVLLFTYFSFHLCNLQLEEYLTLKIELYSLVAELTL